MNKKILSIFGLVMIAMLMMSCANASQIKDVNGVADYDEFMESRAFPPKPLSFFGIDLPFTPVQTSFAKESERLMLMEISYWDETLTDYDDTFWFNLDTGTIRSVYFVAKNKAGHEPNMDVGDDGILEMNVVKTTNRNSHLTLLGMTASSCSGIGTFASYGGGISTGWCDVADNSQTNIQVYYSIQHGFTDDYGKYWKSGLYFADEYIGGIDEDLELSISDGRDAIRRYAMNKYITKNCVDKEPTNKDSDKICDVPIKFSETGVTITDATIVTSKFMAEYVCDIGHGNQMVTESFSDGQTVSMYSFRYPVHHFCPSYPVLILDGLSGQATSDAKVYFDLERGDVVTVPRGKTYVFFYVVQNNKDFPYTCAINEKYDAEDNTCTPSIGIAFLCTSGEWDSDNHMCFVPTEGHKCKNPLATFVQETLKCEWTPPLQALCEQETRGVPVEWEAIRTRYDENYGRDRTTGYCPVGSKLETGDDPSPLNETDDFCIWTDSKGVQKKVGVMPYLPATHAIYNIDTENCEWTPSEFNVTGECEDAGAVYKNGVCEFYPREVLTPCPVTGTAPVPVYDEDSGEFLYWNCVYTATRDECPNGGEFNPESGWCEIVHDTDVVCIEFPDAQWDRATGTCMYRVDAKWRCDEYGGLYDPDLEKCYVGLAQFSELCPLLDDGTRSFWIPELDACISEAELNWSCIKGTYDKETNTCKVQRKTTYDPCPEGTIFIPGTGACHSQAEPKVDCPEGFDYSTQYQTCYIIPDKDCPEGSFWVEEKGLCMGDPVFNTTDCPNGWYIPNENKCKWVPRLEVNCGDYGEPETKPDGTIVCMEIGDVEIKCEKGSAVTNELGEIVCRISPPMDDPGIIGGFWQSIIDFFKFLFFIK